MNLFLLSGQLLLHQRTQEALLLVTFTINFTFIVVVSLNCVSLTNQTQLFLVWFCHYPVLTSVSKPFYGCRITLKFQITNLSPRVSSSAAVSKKLHQVSLKHLVRSFQFPKHQCLTEIVVQCLCLTFLKKKQVLPVRWWKDSIQLLHIDIPVISLGQCPFFVTRQGIFYFAVLEFFVIKPNLFNLFLLFHISIKNGRPNMHTGM